MIAHLLSTTGTWSAMWGVGMCCFNSLNYYHVAKSVFRLGGFFSANRRFFGTRANNFWQHGNHSCKKIQQICGNMIFGKL